MVSFSNYWNYLLFHWKCHFSKTEIGGGQNQTLKKSMTGGASVWLMWIMIPVGRVSSHQGRFWLATAKIITGSFQGFLRIYLPKGRDFKAEDLLLEQQLGAPILHLAVGRFVSYVVYILGSFCRNLTILSLAVLHPRKLTVYNVVQSAGFGEGLQSSFYSFEKKYEHHLEHTSFNMCYGPFGGVQG